MPLLVAQKSSQDVHQSSQDVHLQNMPFVLPIQADKTTVGFDIAFLRLIQGIPSRTAKICCSVEEVSEEVCPSFLLAMLHHSQVCGSDAGPRLPSADWHQVVSAGRELAGKSTNTFDMLV